LKSVLKYQLPPLLWLIVIYFLSSIPNLHVRLRLPLGSDKIAHAIMYFALCWLVFRAFRYQDFSVLLSKGALLGAFIFCCVYGILDEYHQRSIPGRAVDLNDVVAGAGGALLFVALASMFRSRWASKGSQPKS
jgi:VanZ family protein